MKKRAIFEIWHRSSKDERNKLISEFILENHYMSHLEKPPRELQVFVSSLNRKILAKREQSKRTLSRFLVQHEGWLEEEISLPAKFLAMLSPEIPPASQHTRAGRPEKPFEECTLKVKKRKINELVCTKTQAELALAAEVTLRSAGKRDAADIVKELATASPSRATVIKKARKIFNTTEPKLSPELALALMVNAKLSTHQYNILRQQLKSINSNVYPPYDHVKKAKLECYPAEDSIKITEVSAEIKLQALLDLTVRRICAVQIDI